jgi:hypothetical protein
VIIPATFFAKLRARISSEEGFTLTEIAVAAMLSAALGTAVTALITSTITLVGKIESNATSYATTQKVLDNFETLARDALKVKSVSPMSIFFTYQRGTKCELHYYLLYPDSTGIGMKLTHSITEIALSNNTNCNNIDASLSAGALASPTVTTELDNLGPSTRFSYYSATGQQVLVPGDPAYDPTAFIPICQLGGVDFTIENSLSATGSAASTSVEDVRVAFRSNVMGVSC